MQSCWRILYRSTSRFLHSLVLAPPILVFGGLGSGDVGAAPELQGSSTPKVQVFDEDGDESLRVVEEPNVLKFAAEALELAGVLR